jgi:hypothetical protein
MSYRTVTVDIFRKNCPQILDTIQINVPVDQNQSVTVTSQQGLFKATLQKGSLEVIKVQEG